MRRGKASFALLCDFRVSAPARPVCPSSYELRLDVIGPRILERADQGGTQLRVDFWRVEPEESRQSRIDDAERPLVLSEIAENDLRFRGLGVPARDDVVAAMPPANLVAVPNSTGSKDRRVFDKRI